MCRSEIANIGERFERNGRGQYEVPITAGCYNNTQNERVRATNSFSTAEIKNDDPDITAASSTVRLARACGSQRQRQASITNIFFHENREDQILPLCRACLRLPHLVARGRCLPQARSSVLHQNAHTVASCVLLHCTDGSKQAATRLLTCVLLVFKSCSMRV